MSNPPQKPSNLKQLPVEVKQYAQLIHRKRLILREKRKLDDQIQKLNAFILERMSEKDMSAIEISPDSEEAKVYGGVGALQLKVRNSYDGLTQDNLICLAVKFFGYLMPQADNTDVTRLGCGVANWIWNNRHRRPVKYLERVYLEDKIRQKRKKSETTGKEKTKRVRADAIKQGTVPTTRDEFMAVPGFRDMMQAETAGASGSSV